MAADVMALMDALGHERFALAGHDRGGYAAFRAAMDHPERIAALTTFGRAVPIVETLERMGARFAREWWHWFFLGQTSKPAEKVIAAVPTTGTGRRPRGDGRRGLRGRVDGAARSRRWSTACARTTARA